LVKMEEGREVCGGRKNGDARIRMGGICAERQPYRERQTDRDLQTDKIDR